MVEILNNSISVSAVWRLKRVQWSWVIWCLLFVSVELCASTYAFVLLSLVKVTERARCVPVDVLESSLQPPTDCRHTENQTFGNILQPLTLVSEAAVEDLTDWWLSVKPNTQSAEQHIMVQEECEDLQEDKQWIGQLFVAQITAAPRSRDDNIKITLLSAGTGTRPHNCWTASGTVL